MDFYALRRLLAAHLLAGAVIAQPLYRIDNFAGNPSIFDGGPATSATLRQPISVASDKRGGYYIGEVFSFRIRHVNAAGVIRTIAGNGIPAFTVDGAVATEGSLVDASAIAVAPNGDVYFAESVRCRVTRIDSGGRFRHVAGTGNCAYGGDGGPATAASINGPRGIDFDPQGRLLIADTDNGRIRRVAADGTISTIAGTGNTQTFSGTNGTAALATPISYPMGLAAAADGTIYFVEWGYRRIRRIAPDGLVATIAGDGQAGATGDGGPAAQARFHDIRQIALDAARNRIVVVDVIANRVRQVNLSTNVISLVAGALIPSQPSLIFADSFSGDDGQAVGAGLAEPTGIALGDDGGILVADTGNGRIRRIDGTIRTVAGRFFNTSSGPASQAEFNAIAAIGLHPAGDLIVAEAGNRIVRRISGGAVSILAGTPDEKLPANQTFGARGDGGAATSAGFGRIAALGVDSMGRVIVLDGNRLRQIQGTTIMALGTNAIPSTITGPFFVDTPRDRLFAVSGGNNKIVVADLTQGTLTFRDFAGNGSGTSSGDGGTALAAGLEAPTDVAVDASGTVYIAESWRLRRVGLDNVIRTVAGNGAVPVGLLTGADVAATAGPASPRFLGIDSDGRVIFSETVRAGALRVFDPRTNRVRGIAGDGTPGTSGDGGLALAARVGQVISIRGDSAGNVYLHEGANETIRILRPVQLTRFEAVSGSGQRAAAGAKLPEPLVVRVSTATGPIAGAAVTFSGGGAAFNPARAVTGTDGLARTEVTLGAQTGSLTVSATVEGFTNPVTFSLTATEAVVVNPNRPAIRAAGGVATAGAFGGESLLSPGTWIEIYGTNLSPSSRSWGESDFRGAQAPVELDGVRVSIGGRSAYVAFISPGQINAQVPDGIGTGPVAVTVTNTNGTSEPVTITAAAASPALLAPPVFRVAGVQYVAALHQDGAFVGREGLIAGANFRPAKAGDVVTLYGIGFGAVSPVTPAGQVTPAAATLASVRVQIGGRDAQVLFGGLAPGAVGLYQFNVAVPEGAGGDAQLSVTANGQTTRQELRITVAP